MYHAGIKWDAVLHNIQTHDNYMEESYKRGYLWGYEQYAIVTDEIIE